MTVALLPGTLFVPISQPKARLIVESVRARRGGLVRRLGLLQPDVRAEEYMEDYVTEQVARSMLADDPALRQEFESRLASDAASRRSGGPPRLLPATAPELGRALWHVSGHADGHGPGRSVASAVFRK